MLQILISPLSVYVDFLKETSIDCGNLAYVVVRRISQEINSPLPLCKVKINIPHFMEAERILRKLVRFNINWEYGTTAKLEIYVYFSLQ